MIIDSFPQRLNENPYSSGDASAPYAFERA